MKIGDKMPSFQVQDQNGAIVKTEDLLGKGLKIVLYTYPKDNTLGCTAEACSFRDAYEDLRAAGYIVIGVRRNSAARPVAVHSVRPSFSARKSSSNASSTRSIPQRPPSRFSDSIANNNLPCYGKERD